MKIDIVVRWCGVILSLIFLMGCTPPHDPPTEDLLRAYFTQAPKHGDVFATPDPENPLVAPEYHTLLNDRLFIQMPQGAKYIEPWQAKALQGDMPLEFNEQIIWANDSEVFVLSASELLATSSGNIEEDAMNFLTESNTLDLFEVSIANPVFSNPVAILKRNDYVKQGPWGCRNILNALATGADGNLILFYVGIYTTQMENLPYFAKLAEDIIATIKIGTGVLDTQSKEVSLQNRLVLDLPDGHVREYKGVVHTLTEYHYGYNKQHWKFVNNNPRTYKITKIERYKMWESHILFEFDRKMRVRVPSEFETVDYLPDTLLGNEIEWLHTQNAIYYEMQTVVPIEWGQTVRITIQSENEQALQELFGIVHTLKKK